jgi:hypothetical protein
MCGYGVLTGHQCVSTAVNPATGLPGFKPESEFWKHTKPIPISTGCTKYSKNKRHCSDWKNTRPSYRDVINPANELVWYTQRRMVFNAQGQRVGENKCQVCRDAANAKRK